jgi:hypothetical protein
MKKTIATKLQPMTSLYGLKLAATEATIKETDPCVKVCHGWFHLYFGRNEQFGEFLLVMTLSDSFLLSTKQQSAAPVRKRRKPVDWVFAIGNSPVDFFEGSTGSTYLSCGGYSITYGRDHADRDFLLVEMRERHLHLLFRDPALRLTQAWSLRPAVAISDAAVMDPKVSAESADDAELNALLDALG